MCVYPKSGTICSGSNDRIGFKCDPVFRVMVFVVYMYEPKSR